MKTSSISTLAAAGGLLAALAGGAPAEAALASKTLYASGVTAPGGMVFIKDSTAAGGHVWYSDHVNGVCRLDPAGTGATATANPSTCLVFGAATQIAYDPLGKWLYMVDISKRALGVRKIAVNTTTGTLNKLKQSTLVPPVAGMRLTAAAVDPKGNLYIGERQGGGIYKYAATSNTAGAAGAATQVGSTEDGAGVLSFAFGKSTVAGTTTKADDLYVAGAATLQIMPDVNGVDPAGNGACTGANQCTSVDVGFGIFGPQSVAFDGTYVYAGDVTIMHRINPADFSVVDYAVGYSNLSAIVVSDKITNPTTGAVTPRQVYGADDPSAGGATGVGHVYKSPRKP